MSLAPNTRLGPYEILAPLGAGGMGEVFRAKDTRLDREVAIKVLPAAMAADPERIARFEREAKALATLSHPNIAAIYGFEEHEGKRLLVMELAEGETLSERLQQGALPLDETLETARMIAAALEAAHDKGIVHRDLKPANVKISPDGTVKVLDFGLAKALTGEGGSVVSQSPTEVVNSPTITANFTRPGVILGTAGYMSPEQARGRSIDKRTDIWAFGVVLFECLSGARLFAGETVTDSLGAILHKEPEWALLPPNTPPTIQLLLRRCLTKDRNKRLRDIGDARIEIENAIADPTSSSLNLASAALAEGKRRPITLLTVALMLIVAGAAGMVGRLLRPATPAPRVARLTMTIPEDLKLWSRPNLVFSRDGRRLAFGAKSTNSGGQSAADRSSRLFVRDLDQSEPKALAGTEGAGQPAFSPDGEWIAFVQEGKLRKQSIHGGPSIGLCDAKASRGCTWTSRGTIVFAANNLGGLSEVSAAGGTPTPFTELPEDKKSRSHRYPCALPDGHGILFTEATDLSDWDNTSLWAVAEAGGEPRQLATRASHGRYISSGHLVFQREGTLLAAPFDLDRLELRGDPFPVLEGVTDSGGSTPAQFALDDRGTLVYISGSLNREWRLTLMDLEGKKEPIGSQIADFKSALFSPDDSLIAVSLETHDEKRIGVLERSRDILRVLPTEGTLDRAPVWSPDGKWLAFASQTEGGTSNVYRIRADLSGKPERLTTAEYRQFPQDWSPDGALLAIFEIHPETDGDIRMVPFDKSGEVLGDPTPFVVGPGWQWGARFSPDGRWVCYASSESGRAEIYVRPTDGSGSAVQISTNRGWYCFWSPDGQRLFYTESNQLPTTLNFVTYKVEGAVFTPELPQAMFQIEGDDQLRGLDISKDGEHFLMIMPAVEGGESRREPTIILNWAEEVKALVPTGAGR